MHPIQHIFRGHIWGKLFICFVILIFLCVSLVGGFAFYRHVEELKDKQILYADQQLKQIGLSMENALEAMRTSSLVIATNPAVQSILAKDNTILTQAQLLENTRVITANVIMHFNYSAVRALTIQGFNGTRYNVVSDISHSSMVDGEEDYYDLAKMAKGGDFWINNIRTSQVMTLIRSVQELNTWHDIGLIRIDLNANVLQKIIADSEYDPLSDKVIFDANGQFVTQTGTLSESDAELIALAVNDAQLMGKPNASFSNTSGRYICCFTRLPVTGWMVVGVMDASAPYAEVYKYALSFIVVTALAIVLALFVAYHYARTITIPISRVINGMKRVAVGDFSGLVHCDERGELGELCNGFNNMTVETKKLIDEVYKLEIMQRDSEFKALQAQINPHFLYNVLENINWTAHARQMDDICEIITSLSSLLRISINTKNSFITIAEEMRYVRDYMKIQQMRYGPKLQSRFEIDPTLLSVRIPKLIIQPIVENAVVHGIEPMKNGGIVSVRGVWQGGDIIITVEDNGCGMDVSRYEQLQGETPSTPGNGHIGMGVVNVDRRIKILYGPLYGMSIQSSPEAGTTVTIKIADRGYELVEGHRG